MELKFQEYHFAGSPMKSPKCLDEIGKRTVVPEHRYEYGTRAELNDFSSTNFTLVDECKNKSPNIMHKWDLF